MTPSWSRRLVANLLAALSVALTAYLASALVFLLANQLQPLALLSAVDYFLIPGVVLLVLLFFVGLAGAFESWYLALSTGFVAGVVAMFLGSMFVGLGYGNGLPAGIWGSLLLNMLGTNLFFWAASSVAAPTLGRRVHDAVLERRRARRGGPLALVRLPAGNLGSLGGIDVDRADSQWDGFVAALGESGLQTAELPFAEGLASSVFVGEVVVMLEDTAVLARPADESRRAEAAAVGTSLRLRGLDVRTLEGEATLDAGDVLVAGDTVYVGARGGTNGAGIRALREIATPLGFAVVAVVLPRGARLTSLASVLPDGTVIGDAGALVDTVAFERFVAAPESAGARLLTLDEETVLLGSTAVDTAELLSELGYRVVPVEIGEFEGLGRGPGALCVRLD